MPAFTCRSRDVSGGLVEKTIEAATRREALGLLQDSGLSPIEITEILGASRAPVEEPGNAIGRAQPAKNALKRKQLRRFSIQLASSLRAGVPILSALRTIRAQAQDKHYSAVLARMMTDIEGGLSLSGAMRNLPRAFPATYVGTIAAGERSGSLDQMLDNLTEFLEAEMEIRSDVRSALLYPAVVLGTLGLAMVVLVFFVVPRFAEFYSGFNTALPLPTRILIHGSELVERHGAMVLIGLVALVIGAVRLLRLERVRSVVDRLLLRIPVLGYMLETANTLHAVQMLHLSTGAGLPLLESLESIAAATTNTKTRKDLRAVSAAVEAGGSLAGSMEAVRCFPLDARQIIATGEETGSLQQACAVVAEQYKKELRHLAKNIATFIEPLLTLVLAVFVLFLALAAFLPMWDLVKVVGK